jgi:hypothetical protein
LPSLVSLTPVAAPARGRSNREQLAIGGDDVLSILVDALKRQLGSFAESLSDFDVAEPLLLVRPLSRSFRQHHYAGIVILFKEYVRHSIQIE